MQPLRSRRAPIRDRIEINSPAIPAKAVGHIVCEEDSGDETMDLNPYSVSSIDLTNGYEFRTSERKSWKSLLNAAKVVMKSCLSRSEKPRPTRPSDTQNTGAQRVSELAVPLHRTWYKERGGWRWVERDTGEVLTELRKL